MQGLDLFKSVKKREQEENGEESEYEEINEEDGSSGSEDQSQKIENQVKEKEEVDIRKSPKVYIIIED